MRIKSKSYVHTHHKYYDWRISLLALCCVVIHAGTLVSEVVGRFLSLKYTMVDLQCLSRGLATSSYQLFFG